MSKIRYGKTIASCAAVAILAAFLTLVLTHSGGAKPRPAPSPQPAPLSEFDRGAIAEGSYATAINIHNPSLRETITLHKRAVIALEENSPQSPPSAFVTVTLPAGNAVEVDCEDINGLISPGATTNFSVFTKGFVTILATGALDVVGVYSGNPSARADGITLEMLNIAPRIESGPPTSVAVPGRFYEYSAKFLCGPNNPT
jgi:hypothetical protein